MHSLGQKLRKLRREREWSGQKLADLAGVSRMTIFRIEKGRTSGVRLDTLESIAKVLGVSVQELLSEEEEERLATY